MLNIFNGESGGVNIKLYCGIKLCWELDAYGLGDISFFNYFP